MKENFRSENEEYKIMRLSSVKSKILKIEKNFFSGYNTKSEILLEYFLLLKKYFLSGYNLRMLEITINCYKCDLETINDPNNSQYFWINRRDSEIETKHNWQVIYSKI